MIADQIFLANIWWERFFCRCDIIGDLHSKWILVDGQKVRIGDNLVRLALSYNYISFSFRIVFVFCQVGDIILPGDGAEICAKHERSFHQAPESEHAPVLGVCHATLVGTKIKDIIIKSFHQNERLLCQQKAHQGNSTQVLAPELQPVCNAPNGYIDYNTGAT